MEQREGGLGLSVQGPTRLEREVVELRRRLKEAEGRCEGLACRVDEVVRVVREVEWVAHPLGGAGKVCAWCGGTEEHGHVVGCRREGVLHV